MPNAVLKRRLAILLIVAASVWLVVTLVGGDSGLLALRRTKGRYEGLESRVEQLQRENDALREEIRRLKEEPDEIELRARESLMMARPDEEVILIRNRESER